MKLSRFIEVHNLDGPRYVLHCKNNGLVTSRVSGTRGFIILKGESRGSLGEVAHATRSAQNFSPGPVPKSPKCVPACLCVLCDPEEKPSCHKRTKNEQGGNYKSHLSLTESVRLRLLLIMFMAHNLLPQCLLLPASAILSFVWIDYVAAYDPHSYPFAASLVAPPACVGYTFVCLG